MNKVCTLLYKYLQESSISIEFSPGGNAFLVVHLMLYSTYCLCHEWISAYCNLPIIKHQHLHSMERLLIFVDQLSNVLHFSTPVTLVQSTVYILHYYINVLTEAP